MTKELTITLCCWCFNPKFSTLKFKLKTNLRAKKPRKSYNFFVHIVIQPGPSTPETVHIFDTFTLLHFWERFIHRHESEGQLLMMYIFCDSCWFRGTSPTLTLCESNLKVSLVIAVGGSLRLVKWNGNLGQTQNFQYHEPRRPLCPLVSSVATWDLLN